MKVNLYLLGCLVVLIATVGAVPCRADGLEVLVGGKVLSDGDTWYTPMNNPANSIALFSKQRDVYSITNRSGAPIVLDMIELTITKGVAEEFSLQNTSYRPSPLNFKKVTLAPRKRFSFYVRFYPVHSGQRSAVLSITYNSTQKMSFSIIGKGRTDAKFFSHGELSLEKLMGGRKTDEMATAMVADGKGNMYFSGHVTQVIDKFAFDIVLGRINSDGTLAWVKIWNGKYRDYCPDPGQNGESGGCATSLAIDTDGFIYLSGSCSPKSYNNNFATLVLKVDPASGKILWERLWRPEWPRRLLAKHNAMGYGLDVNGGRVYVTGELARGIFLLALDKNDGNVLFQQAVDPYPTYKSRGYTIKADKTGNVYIGGIAKSNAILIKYISNANRLKFTWAKKIDLGRGGNINCIDIDAAGNLYLACDRRGATTYFSALKVSPKGDLVWGKTYKGSNSDQNNINIVKAAGENVYLGGRISLTHFDTQFGDALVAKLSGKDGSHLWSSFYYTGKGPDEIGEHRVKGIAVGENSLSLFGQVYTGNLNGVRYWGYWYDGPGKLDDYTPAISPISVGTKQLRVLVNGKAKPVAQPHKYVDGNKYFAFQDARAKHDGKGPDGDFIIWRINLK